MVADAMTEEEILLAVPDLESGHVGEALLSAAEAVRDREPPLVKDRLRFRVDDALSPEVADGLRRAGTRWRTAREYSMTPETEACAARQRAANDFVAAWEPATIEETKRPVAVVRPTSHAGSRRASSIEGRCLATSRISWRAAPPEHCVLIRNASGMLRWQVAGEWLDDVSEYPRTPRQSSTEA